ncbi:ABC transporter substrate-binding protein [Frankia sp. CNm7]|uniref:ABC transporter substrate-binding protein n=1 Tax=Frankia nepalensis TaxID=1836974 RepID=A0A937RR21_9ACTN|nr:ABC transporter substrate-binding protein [Frankia nepalensis]MBL7496221.1 ABC transporter substrate-binding protein [Frankia nepalensis]MBL7511640.1 ABC transporter substrate-binding protein [Frankia nepalensis]MBL7517735.1 ABC transporter substrate-binding protein [Frankia nepalensis]MBL7631118.1 ABC transporter substrate-binding protein [Frankia nepalensis]
MTAHRSRLRVGAGLTSALLAGAVVLSACGGDDDGDGSSDGGARTRATTVLLDWDPNPDHVALYTARDAGYFTAAGLDVTLQPPSDPSDPTKLVSTGKIDLGISYEPETIIAGSMGLDVVAVGALVPTALTSIMATEKSGVRSVNDLAGKKLATAGLATQEAFFKTILAQNGLDASSVEKINVGQDLLAAMVTGNVDATLGAFRNIEAVQLADQGLNPTVIPVTEAGVPNYDELVIIAQASRLKSDPAYQRLVRDFLGALARGNAVVLDDPATAAQTIAKVAEGYDPRILPKMVDATVPLLRNPAGFGHHDLDAWQSFADWMAAENLIDKPVRAADVVTNAYLPAG